MQFSRLCLLFLTICLSGVGAALEGQYAPRRIPYRIACPQCTIELTKVVAFDSGPNVPPLGGVGGIQRDGTGRFFISSYDLSQIIVFGPDGRYVATIGRRGDGPGEFGIGLISGIQGLQIGSGDTLFVFHFPPQIQVFSPSLRPVRTVKLRGQRVNFTVLDNGDFFVKERINSPAHIGHPLHYLSPTGAVLRSFGGDGRPIGPGFPQPSWEGFAPSPDRRSVWMARAWTYGVKHWSLDGTVLHDFEFYNVPWYPPQDSVFDRNVDIASLPPRPSSMLGGVDARGLLWINAMTPVGADQRTATYNWHVEVLDPRTGEIIATRRMEKPLKIIPGTNLGYTYAESPDGDLRFSILQVAVSGR